MTGEELKALRTKFALTQSQLGERLGITASAVAHIESGKNTMSRQTAMLVDKLTQETA